MWLDNSTTIKHIVGFTRCHQRSPEFPVMNNFSPQNNPTTKWRCPKMGATSKSFIYFMGFSIINHPFGGSVLWGKPRFSTRSPPGTSSPAMVIKNSGTFGYLILYSIHLCFWDIYTHLYIIYICINIYIYWFIYNLRITRRSNNKKSPIQTDCQVIAAGTTSGPQWKSPPKTLSLVDHKISQIQSSKGLHFFEEYIVKSSMRCCLVFCRHTLWNVGRHTFIHDATIVKVR